jgi:hypothetical protein
MCIDYQTLYKFFFAFSSLIYKLEEEQLKWTLDYDKNTPVRLYWCKNALSDEKLDRYLGYLRFIFVRNTSYRVPGINLDFEIIYLTTPHQYYILYIVIYIYR